MKYLSVSLKAVVESRAEIAGQLKSPGDAVLVQRGQPRWLLLKCPCGCGEDIPVNLDRRAGKAWRLYSEKKTGLTLFPSVWRDTGCGSHFIVWRNQILLFGTSEDEMGLSRADPQLLSLASRVLEKWPSGEWTTYVDVADLLREIPWDVLDACRHLARVGSLIEGRGRHHGMFRRR